MKMRSRTASDVVVKSSGSTIEVKISIIQQIDRKNATWNEIDRKSKYNVDLSLLQEIEAQIIYSGTKLNIDYIIVYIIIMDDGRRYPPWEYFMSASNW